jgi:hypothetical protein
VIVDLVINPSPKYSAEFVALFQHATGEQSVQIPGNWLSFGMRPIYKVSDHFRVALE